ncbi:MAG TPA: hypothetical protein VF595_17060 [Tepidisphaeraceae bacterium]|jgi:hypothetical protein
MRHRLLAAVAVLTATLAQGAGPVDVSPLLTDRTIAVARIDLTQLKMRPVADWLIDSMKRAGAPTEQLTAAYQGGSAVALLGQPIVDGLRRLGVNDAAFVVQAHENPGQMPVAILAFTKPADPAAAVRTLAPLGFRNGQIGNLQVFSPNLPPGTLAKLQPVVRPDLADPAADTDGHVLTIAFVPHPSMATNPASKGVAMLKRTTMQLDVRTEPRLTTIVRTASPEIAAEFKQKIAEQQQQFSDRPQSEADRIMAKALSALPMIVDGSDVTIDLRQADFDAFVSQYTSDSRPAPRPATP